MIVAPVLKATGFETLESASLFKMSVSNGNLHPYTAAIALTEPSANPRAFAQPRPRPGPVAGAAGGSSRARGRDAAYQAVRTHAAPQRWERRRRRRRRHDRAGPRRRPTRPPPPGVSGGL